MGVEDTGKRHPDFGDHHHDLRIGPGRKAESTIIGRDGGPEQAEFLHLLDHGFRVDIAMLQLEHMRTHLALEPLADGLQHLPLFGFANSRSSHARFDRHQRSPMVCGIAPGASGMSFTDEPRPEPRQTWAHTIDLGERGENPMMWSYHTAARHVINPGVDEDDERGS